MTRFASMLRTHDRLEDDTSGPIIARSFAVGSTRSGLDGCVALLLIFERGFILAEKPIDGHHI
jgi:hypothetical protein